MPPGRVLNAQPNVYTKQWTVIFTFSDLFVWQKHQKLFRLVTICFQLWLCILRPFPWQGFVPEAFPRHCFCFGSGCWGLKTSIWLDWLRTNVNLRVVCSNSCPYLIELFISNWATINMYNQCQPGWSTIEHWDFHGDTGFTLCPRGRGVSDQQAKRGGPGVFKSLLVHFTSVLFTAGAGIHHSFRFGFGKTFQRSISHTPQPFQVVDSLWCPRSVLNFGLTSRLAPASRAPQAKLGERFTHFAKLDEGNNYMVHMMHMIYDLWFMIYDLWFMMYDLWCMIYDLWFMIYDLWFMI